MARQDVADLGIDDEEETPQASGTAPRASPPPSEGAAKRAAGFVAGVRPRPPG